MGYECITQKTYKCLNIYYFFHAPMFLKTLLYKCFRRNRSAKTLTINAMLPASKYGYEK